MRFGPENYDHEDLVVPAKDVTVQGRVVYVVHPSWEGVRGGCSSARREGGCDLGAPTSWVRER